MGKTPWMRGVEGDPTDKLTGGDVSGRELPGEIYGRGNGPVAGNTAGWDIWGGCEALSIGSRHTDVIPADIVHSSGSCLPGRTKSKSELGSLRKEQAVYGVLDCLW